MSSQVIVDICNSAMIKLGADPFNSLTDDTKEARLCNHQYHKVRDAVLRSAPWTFATRRATLPKLAQTLEFGDGYMFQLPADCLRVWKLYDADPQARYTIEEDKLITNLDVCQIFYVTDQTDVTKYSADFKESLACQLAADLAFSITQSANLKAGLIQESELWMGRARSTASQEVTPDNFKFDEFLNSRRGGRAFYE